MARHDSEYRGSEESTYYQHRSVSHQRSAEMDRSRSSYGRWASTEGPALRRIKGGSRSIGGQRKRFKDTLKRSQSVCNIDTDKWKSTAQDRIQWRSSVQDGSNVFESECIATAEEKRKKKRKAIRSQQPSTPATINLTCTVYGRVCTAALDFRAT